LSCHQFNLSLARGIGDASIKERFERTSKALKEAELRSLLDENQVRDLERRINHTKETWLVAVKDMVKIIDSKSGTSRTCADDWRRLVKTSNVARVLTSLLSLIW
jgi:hypothetical protein